MGVTLGTDVCWQKRIRDNKYQEDLRVNNFSEEFVKSLRVKDFDFEAVEKKDRVKVNEIVTFIKEYEWVGKMPQRPTHYFTMRYKGLLAGVVVMATPNAFSVLLGKSNRDIEKLLARGACASWAPKGLNSSLVAGSIDWMLKNTTFRVFSAYSDPEAGELGTIYQACNFFYLGQKFGGRFRYFDPDKPESKGFSDREFRKGSFYKKVVKKYSILVPDGAFKRDKILWSKIPVDIEKKIKDTAKHEQQRFIKKKSAPKHKYIYIGSKSTSELKKLYELFLKHNPKLHHFRHGLHRLGLVYPKDRGSLKTREDKFIKDLSPHLKNSDSESSKME